MVKMIWCEDKNHGIGKDNKLPWHLPEELKHFKETTSGGVVLMGYNTYLSIGKPLPNRTNVVVTRKHKDADIKGVVVYSNLKKAIKDFAKNDLFIIGGKTIFEQALKDADELIVTYLLDDYECDVKLKIKLDDFDVTKTDESNKQFKIIYYKRKPEKLTNISQDDADEMMHQVGTIFNLKFENFSGPFDLLLSLIQEKKMDIMQLDLAALTEQYLAFIKKNIKTVDIEQITDYLVMATYLIELKSKKIIPVDENQEDIDIENNKERDRLVKRLIEYKRYREILPELEQFQLRRLGLFGKEPDDWKAFQPDASVIPEAPLPDYINPMRLYQAMKKVFDRMRNKVPTIQKIVVQELSIEDVQAEIYEIIKNAKQKRISLTRILNSVDTLKVNTMYFVTCFVALLVLVRYQKIDLFQSGPNAEIYAELTDPKRLEEKEESPEEMIKRHEEFKKEAEIYKKQMAKERAEAYFKQREEFLKKKYGDAYVSREDYKKMTNEQKAALKEKQAKINSQKDAK
ncbi:segregation/condensation protein A [[Mycoplasma] testudinis]|uniref:segregation/condensation protein A n=1 Tax=[Mycoplasma] testudinis TaxID=33924 RepID=UPI000696F687|nr:segregation/condensation protein A [[Mycoplasma] testudinis]